VIFLAAQVPSGGPAQVVEVIPPLIRYGDYVFGGGRWEAWRKKYPGGSFEEFAAKRSEQMRRKLAHIKSVFANLDPQEVERRKRRRRLLRRSSGEPHMGFATAVKEEPVEEVPVDLGPKMYCFTARRE
jgi:hypothetical protein